LANKLHTGLAN